MRGALWIPLVVLLLSPSGSATAGPDSLRDEVFYQIMPIAWRDSDLDTSRFGDFGGMTASLDYLDSLGITSIWMNPIFPSPAYHGYQHGPADQLNPWFGTEAEFVAFVEAAHARSMKVYVDLVAYGISQNSVWFNDAFANPASIYDDWLAFEDGANTQFLGSNYTTWNGSSVGFIHWDLRNPLVSGMVRSWAQKWLDPNADGNLSDGLDGFRLDHVWEFYPLGPSGWGYNIADFWVPFGQEVRSVNPQALLVAEQADWGTYGTQLFAGVDAAFTKPFEFAARDALAQELAAPAYASLAATVGALDAASAPGTFLTTIGNHDVSRLATVIGDSFEKGKVAAALLMTQPFAPVIYYGDEIGMRGAKDNGLGGDASDIPMREPFKWNRVEGAPMSRYLQLNPGAWNSRIARDNDGRSVEEQVGVAGSLLESYRQLIALRRAHPALRRGSYAAAAASDGAILAFARLGATEQALVVLNLSGAAKSFGLDLSAFVIPGGGVSIPLSWIDGTTYSPLSSTNLGSYSMSLPAYGYDLLQVDLARRPPAPDAVDGRQIFGANAAVQNAAVEAGFDNRFELDHLRLRVQGGRLDVGLGGNLDSGIGGLCLFYDLNPGGQNLLDMSGITPPPSGPELLGGTRFDTGFTPEGFLYINNFQGQLYVDHFLVFEGGGATKTYRGVGNVGSGNGILAGGTNPNGLEVALDNTNLAGVDSTGTGGAGLVTTGVELSVDLTDLGYDGSQASLRLAAALLRYDGSFTNQWLPGLGEGAADAGLAPDLSSIPGSQFVSVSLGGGAVATPPAGRLELRVRSRGGSTDIYYSLASSAPITLRIYDLRGRFLRELTSGRVAAGEHRVQWDRRDARGLRVAAGVYLLRLESGTAAVSAKTVVID